MSRRTKRNEEGGGQSVCAPPTTALPLLLPLPQPPNARREREKHITEESAQPPQKKALFDFLLWDLLSLLKRLIGSINF